VAPVIDRYLASKGGIWEGTQSLLRRAWTLGGPCLAYCCVLDSAGNSVRVRRLDPV